MRLAHRDQPFVPARQEHSNFFPEFMTKEWRVVSACIFWAGMLTFLTWFIVFEKSRTSDTTFVITKTENVATLRYPGMLICPSYVSPDDRVFARAGGSVHVEVPTLFNAYRVSTVYRDGYAVCPQSVTFTNPKDPKDSQSCVNFNPKPRLEMKQANATRCVPALQQQGTYYFPVSVPEFNSYGYLPPTPWEANRTYSNIYIRYKADNVSNYPIQVVFYSDNSVLDYPQTFEEFQELFSVSGPTSVSFDKDLFVAIRLRKKKIQRPEDSQDRLGSVLSKSACDVDDFESDVSSSHSLDAKTSVVFFSYDTLSVENACVLPVFDALDVVGVLGGAIALLMFGTYCAKIVIDWCTRRFGKTAQNNGYSPAVGSDWDAMGVGMHAQQRRLADD